MEININNNLINFNVFLIIKEELDALKMDNNSKYYKKKNIDMKD